MPSEDTKILEFCQYQTIYYSEELLKKKLQMEKKLQKIYPTYYKLLIAQDLWQAHYQILSIIFLREFIELNAITDMMIKNVKLVELNASIATMFLNTQILKMI